MVYAADGKHQWTRQLAANDAWDGTYVSTLAVDGSGNAWVAGRYNGVLGLGESTVKSPEHYSRFFAKLGPNGAPRWLTDLGEQRIDDGTAWVVVSPGGQAIATKPPGDKGLCVVRDAQWDR